MNNISRKTSNRSSIRYSNEYTIYAVQYMQYVCAVYNSRYMSGESTG